MNRQTVADYLNENIDPLLWRWTEIANRAHHEAQNGVVKTEADSRWMKRFLLIFIDKIQSARDAGDIDLNFLIQKIQETDYSSSNFTVDSFCLEDALQEILQKNTAFDPAFILDILQTVRKELTSLTTLALEETADIYEEHIETGGRPFCYTAVDGKIVYANTKMREVRGQICSDADLDYIQNYFEGEERSFVLDTLKNATPGEQARMLQTVNHGTADSSLGNRDEKKRPFDVMLKPRIVRGQHKGAYISLTDLSIAVTPFQRALDHLPLPVVRVDRNKTIVYANRKAAKLWDEADLEGKHLHTLFADPDALRTVEQQLRQRFCKARSSTYETTITKLSDNNKIPVQIYATPAYDLRNALVGSIAVIRSLELETMTRAINESVTRHNDAHRLLTDVTELIAARTDFDYISVNLYSRDLQHVRSLFSFSPGIDENHFEVGWWQLPEQLKRWAASDSDNYIEDITEFIARPEWRQLRDDPSIARLLEKKLHSLFRIPVFREDRLVASIAFFKAPKNAFTAEERDFLERLPLRKVIQMVLYLEEKRGLNFRLELLKDILNVSGNLQQIADIVTRKLANHYQWENVEIFRIDHKSDEFILCSQFVLNSRYRLPKDYSQPLHKGIMGHVYQQEEVDHYFCGNVHDDPNIKDYYIPGHPKQKIKSELCIPILKYGKPFWMLNVEDVKKNAFSVDEVEELELLHREISSVIEASIKHYHLDKTFEYSSDAILTADCAGLVQSVNQAAEKLLGLSSSAMVNEPLEEILPFSDKNLANWIILGGTAVEKEAAILTGKGDEIPVNLSISRLPANLGGSIIIIIRDLTIQMKFKELDYLGTLYHELSAQAKKPLSILENYLTALKHEDRREKISLYAGEMNKHLNKLRLTYDRLAFYDPRKGISPYNLIECYFSEIVNNIEEDFPEHEWKRLQFSGLRPDRRMKIDMYKITFCLESILLYLLRRTMSAPIRIDLTNRKKTLFCKIVGCDAEDDSGSAPSREAAVDLAIGERIIRRFMNYHKGTFGRKKQADTHVFTLTLPLEAREVMP